MMRIALLLLLVALAGCSKESGSPGSAIPRAAALRDKGDFKHAFTVLTAALNDFESFRGPAQGIALPAGFAETDQAGLSVHPRGPLQQAGRFRATNLTSQEFDQWVEQGRFDSRMIDGKRKYVGTSVANLFFRYPELRSRRINDKDDIAEQKERMLVGLAIKKAAREKKTPYVLPHYFLCTMSVRVDQDALPRSKYGKLIRAWLPVPRYYPYQNDFELIHSSTPVMKLAPESSPIRSAYFEQHSARNQDTVFSITYSYMRSGVYFDMDPEKVCQPDLQDPELKKYTSESPHVVFTDQIRQLAGEIASKETNSLRVAKAFFDWIGSNIKYSYAREYSTLTNISDYCLTNRYGDCGQESLLFITLCRSRGIPARWQSGWA